MIISCSILLSVRNVLEFNILKYRQDNVRAEYCSSPAEDSNVVDCDAVSLGDRFLMF
jgi:hypothetical protein